MSKAFTDGFLRGAALGTFVGGLLGFIFFAGIVHRHLGGLMFFAVATIVGGYISIQLFKNKD